MGWVLVHFEKLFAFRRQSSRAFPPASGVHIRGKRRRILDAAAMKRQRAQSLLAPTPRMLNINPFPASPTLMPLRDEHGEGTADRWDRSPAWANPPPIVIPPPVNLSDCLPDPSGRASPCGSPLGSDPFGLNDGMGIDTPPASRAAEENARDCKAPLRRFSETVRSRPPMARARLRRGVAGILSSA